MRVALLCVCILLLSAGGALLFRALYSESRVGAIRWAWALYLAVCAWLVDNGSADAWSGGVYLTWLSGMGERPYDWAPSFAVPVLLLALAVALWLGSIGISRISLGVGDWRDVLRLNVYGLLLVGPAALVLLLAKLGTPWPLLIAGTLCGPIYARLPRHAVWIFGGVIAAGLMVGAAFG